MKPRTKMRPPRTVNFLTRPVGTHWTLTRVIGEGADSFGFCISDDGEEGYIPRHVVERYEITPQDETGGFWAPSRPSKMRDGTDGSPQIQPPILFDADIIEEEEDNLCGPAGIDMD